MTKFIAELCQNHLGSTSNLEQMVILAKKSGADYAKIQGLYSYELTKRPEFENPNNPIYRPFESEFERLSSLDLTSEQESWFVRFCISNSVIPMITVFTHEGIKRAKSAGFKHIKIASYDCNSIPLIEGALSFADEVIISTGATSWKDLNHTCKFVSEKKKNNQKVVLLHAKTIYPTQLNEFNLLRMAALKYFGYDTGLSDHSKPSDTGLIASKVAILLGAKYIERHFTIFNKSKTKDGPISVTPEELMELKDFSMLNHSEQISQIKINDLITLLGGDLIEPSGAELNNRKYYRGRVATNYKGKLFNSWEKF